MVGNLCACAAIVLQVEGMRFLTRSPQSGVAELRLSRLGMPPSHAVAVTHFCLLDLPLFLIGALVLPMVFWKACAALSLVLVCRLGLYRVIRTGKLPLRTGLILVMGIVVLFTIVLPIGAGVERLSGAAASGHGVQVTR